MIGANLFLSLAKSNNKVNIRLIEVACIANDLESRHPNFRH